MAMDEESPLVDQSQIGDQTLNHSRDIHILSWAFLLIFLAYGAAQNLQSTLNTDGDLGTISLGILYSSFTVSSLFASSVVRMLGSKNALLLGTTGYWLYIAANLKPSWYTMVPASLYLGFATAIIWVGEVPIFTIKIREQITFSTIVLDVGIKNTIKVVKIHFLTLYFPKVYQGYQNDFILMVFLIHFCQTRP